MAAQMQPSNIALVAGNGASLNCSAGSLISFAQWIFYPTGLSTPITVYQGLYCTEHPAGYPIAGYTLNSTNTGIGQCDLIITNVTRRQAGWYTCDLTVMAPSTPVSTIAAQITIFGEYLMSCFLNRDLLRIHDNLSMFIANC